MVKVLAVPVTAEEEEEEEAFRMEAYCTISSGAVSIISLISNLWYLQHDHHAIHKNGREVRREGACGLLHHDSATARALGC
jgi:hypothetical protein